MKKLLALLLALTGVAAMSCERGGYQSYYGTIDSPYEEKSAVNNNSTTPSPCGTDMDAVITETTSEE